MISQFLHLTLDSSVSPIILRGHFYYNLFCFSPFFGSTLTFRAVIKRLGFILELLMIDSPIIDELRKVKSAAYVLLDTELPKTGKMISRWSVQQNLETETIKAAIYT